MRHATLTLVLPVLTALCLGGCGDDDGPTRAQGSAAHAEIRNTIADFYGDDQLRICETLSSRALRQVGGMRRCAGSASQPLRTRFEVTRIVVTGNSAAATVRASGLPVRFRLVRRGEEWKIERPLPLVF